MMKPEGLDATTIVIVNFAHELIKRNKRLEEELKAQQEACKRSQKMMDDYRESLRMPRMYEKFPETLYHRNMSPFYIITSKHAHALRRQKIYKIFMRNNVGNGTYLVFTWQTSSGLQRYINLH
jgi:phage regulator Rha-like protein